MNDSSHFKLIFDSKPNRDEVTFGMQTSRRGDTFREGTNPFTGEVVRFYNSTSTEEECVALEETLKRYGIHIDCEALEYSGEIHGTRICLPDIDLRDRYFGGTSIELVGEKISDESIVAVLDMGKAAAAYYSTHEGPLAAPTSEIKARAEEHHVGEIVLVDTVEKLRNWLIDHVGVRRVI